MTRLILGFLAFMMGVAFGKWVCILPATLATLCIIMLACESD